MKKFVLLLIIGMFIFSCKKDDTQPVSNKAADTATYYGMGYYDIYVNSNYAFPFVRVEKDTTVLKYINWGIQDDSVAVHYKLNANIADEYEVYAHCSKNAMDSTMDMLDNNILWNRITIIFNNDTIHDSTSYDNDEFVAQAVQQSFKFNVR